MNSLWLISIFVPQHWLDPSKKIKKQLKHIGVLNKCFVFWIHNRDIFKIFIFSWFCLCVQFSSQVLCQWADQFARGVDQVCWAFGRLLNWWTCNPLIVSWELMIETLHTLVLLCLTNCCCMLLVFHRQVSILPPIETRHPWGETWMSF